MTLLREYYQAGGPIALIIFIMGILALFIVLERLYHYRRATVDVEEFMHGLINNLRNDNLVEALAILEETPGPVSSILQTALKNADRSEADLRNVITDTSLNEIPRLEQRLTLLATIAHLAPLLGFFGTVQGMIGAFDELNLAETAVNAQTLAKHIKLALYTTSAGLLVTIFAHGAYNFLLRKLKDMLLDMEKAQADICYFLLTHPVNRTSVTARTASHYTPDSEEQGKDSDAKA